MNENAALPSEQVDLLVSRLVDGVAEAGEWERFSALAESRPAAWKTLAVAQQQQAALQLEFDRRVAGIHVVDVAPAPAPLVPGAVIVRHGDGTERIRTWSRLAGFGMWSGWLAAAGVALAWAAGGPMPMRRDGAMNGAAIGPAGWTINTPDDAVDAYLRVGAEQQRVLGEVPGRVLVSSRQLEPGKGVEVVFVRRFMERAVVDDLDLVRFGRDELGRSVPMPVVVPVSTGRGE